MKTFIIIALSYNTFTSYPDIDKGGHYTIEEIHLKRDTVSFISLMKATGFVSKLSRGVHVDTVYMSDKGPIGTLK